VDPPGPLQTVFDQVFARFMTTRTTDTTAEHAAPAGAPVERFVRETGLAADVADIVSPVI